MKQTRGGTRQRLRQVGLLLTGCLPQALKRLAYRWCFGYRIGARAHIGLAYLDCETLSIGDHARIGHGTVFLRCGNVQIGSHARIGLLNLFRGGDRIHIGDYADMLRLNVINAIPDNDCTSAPESVFSLGYGSLVTAEHRIDFTDRVEIGRCTIFGGRNSSIWTHNIRSTEPVRIGDYCYVGSETRMAPGATIPNCCVVGLGSVVVHPCGEAYSLIAGVPAKRRRALAPEDYDLIFRKHRPDLPDEIYPMPPCSPALALRTN